MSQTQFSIRTLLAAVAVVAIGAALWVAEPSWQVGAVEALFLIWIPASAVMLTIQSAGKARAFWIGAAAHCIMATFMVMDFEFTYNRSPYPLPTSLPHVVILWFCGQLAASFRPVLLAWAFAPVVGLLCVFTHLLLIRPSEPKV